MLEWLGSLTEYRREVFCRTVCFPANLVGKCPCESHALEEKPNLTRLCRLMQVCPFSLRVVSVVGITYLLPQEEQPLCHPTVER